MSSSATSAADPILVSYHDSIVRLSNLKTLDDYNWLDDNIITFAFEYLQYDTKYISTHEDVFGFIGPPVVQLLKMSDDSFAEQLLQSIDFLKKKFLILPINNNKQEMAFAGTHWSLLILSIQERVFYHFDSASSSNDQTAKDITKKFQVFFYEPAELVNCRCPQQNNSFDCGLYVIVIVEEFCRFIYDYYSSRNWNVEQWGENIFQMFINDIQKCVTSDYINQRRKQLKTLVESMNIAKK